MIPLRKSSMIDRFHVDVNLVFVLEKLFEKLFSLLKLYYSFLISV